MMNAANITASMAAATFSARRRNQAPASRITWRALLQRVDLLEQPLRPRLRLVGGEINLLRVRTEGVLVRSVDVQPLLAEAVGELGLALQVLGGAPVDRLVGGRLEGLLLRRPHAVPGLQVHRQQVVTDQV